MVVGRLETVDIYSSLKVRNYYFNRTIPFKYLGSLLTEKNEIEEEIYFFGLA